jgi:uncharacterized protein (TIGR03437 family)
MFTRLLSARACSATLRRSALAKSVCLGLSLLVTLCGLIGSKSKQLGRRQPAYLRAQIEEIGEEFREGSKRQEWFYQQRAYPLDEIPRGAREAAITRWDEVERAQASLRKSGKLALVPEQEVAWQALGPRPIINGQTFGARNSVSGRVTTITLDPRYDGVNNKTVYVGAAQGGLWRSTDNGLTWKPITEDLPSLAVGAVAIDPTNPNVIWVGTGEPNRSGDSYFGAGLFKTTDGGISWQQITGPVSTTDPKLPVFLNCTFSKIEIDPSKPNTLFVATNTGYFLAATRTPGPAPLGNRGLWKTTDGGLNWINVNPTNSRLDRLASDVVIDPRNRNRVYAALNSEGIFRSDNGGDLFSWKWLTRGLPPKEDQNDNPLYGRIALAIGPPIGSSNNSTLYAAFAGADENLLGIYRSTDNGESWTEVTKPQDPGQANYNLALAVDPTNGNNVFYGTSANEDYVAGVLFRSFDAGRSWEDITQGGETSGDNRSAIGLHADTHAIAISAANHNILFTGNDGGIWRTDNALSGGLRWVNLNETLNITQFQSVAVHPYDPSLIIGGTQDNGTNRYNGSPGWEHIDDGDGGFTLIDQSNPLVFYHTYFNISIPGLGAIIGPAISLDSGQSWELRGCFGCNQARVGNFNPGDRVAFYAPMALNTGYSGATGNAVYFGTYRLYRTVDRGKNWLGLGGGVDGYGDDLTKGKGVVTAIAAFPSRGGIDAVGEVVWTGSSDGKVCVTQTAHELTRARFFDVTRSPLPNRFVTDIAIDPRNVQRAVATYSGFNRSTPSTPGHVFLTESFGGGWTDISGNLPDVPVTSVVLDPNKPSTIYIGTDMGVFMTTDTGRNWVRLGNGMPRVSVLQLRYHLASGSLVAATHGRGMYRLTVNPRPLTTVSAASFNGNDLAAEAIVASFGTEMATKTEAANKLPLPTELAGTRLYVRDAFGTERQAALFFVSPGQINFQIPPGTIPGLAMITVISSDGKTSVGFTNINYVTPSLFTANSNGTGVPTGAVYRVRANGTTAVEPLAQLQGTQYVPLPIDVSNQSEQVFLVIFGTGFRNRSALSAAGVTFTGNGFNPIAGTVTFVGAQGSLVGLDQLNLRVPPSMAGRGEVNLVLSVEGKQANVVRVNFK